MILKCYIKYSKICTSVNPAKSSDPGLHCCAYSLPVTSECAWPYSTCIVYQPYF